MLHQPIYFHLTVCTFFCLKRKKIKDFFIEHCTWTCKFVPDQVRKRTFFQNIWCIFKVWPDKKYAPSKIWFTYNFKLVVYSLDLNFVCICNIISYAYVCRPFKISENVNLFVVKHISKKTIIEAQRLWVLLNSYLSNF